MLRHGWLLLFLLAGFGAAHAQWEMENSGTTADLRGIDNVGGGVAWASGTNGTVLRTEDGGYLWQSCSVPPGAEHLDFRGIQAFDANTAIAMSSGKGDLSRLYETTDGCYKWNQILKNDEEDGFWDALVFQRSDFGYISLPDEAMLIGDPLHGRFDTHFGYKRDHWFVDTAGCEAKPEEAAFAASNSSVVVLGLTRYVVGTGGKGGPRALISPKLLKGGVATDPCLEVEVPMAGGTESAGIFSLALRDEQHLVAIGGDYAKPNESSGTAAYSSDAARHWYAAVTPPHGYRSAVAYNADAKTWITVGPNGTDVSTDDGLNWRALHPDPALHEAPDADRNWNALLLPFVVGPHGRIGKLNPHALAPASH